ncbi:MAG TPA: carbamoyltransferase HypF, partial [Acidobacteriota bacterium]|nr:carbamoyltransferase HypF [Acidobacteriota bacterium]
SLEYSLLDPAGFTGFEILESDDARQPPTLILPDIAACDRCLAEIADRRDRRYRYPFTNCANCGPRFSIIESLPYDRPNTSMKSFTMCSACRKEYDNPGDRRFHAQPIACPACGPRLQLLNAAGDAISSGDEALRAAAGAVLAGKILAVKGIGGFQLIADARNAMSVETLRRRKHREEKPFALMYPSLARVREDCAVTPLEERLLRSPESPIVLLARTGVNAPGVIAESVAPGNPSLGIMLPYTPLHHLLMEEIGAPVIATSGNLSDEPICISEHDAVSRLAGVADMFLVHDRPIVRHVDDSIVRVTLGRELVLRRARGYAPLPLRYGAHLPAALAVGAHLKNTIAVTSGRNIFISQHIGDLETRLASDTFQTVIGDFRELFAVTPECVAADLHPDYASSKFASRCGVPVTPVQHHYAHVAACMAENGLDGPVLGIAWDGTGYGHDGTIWGGEFLLTDDVSFTRAAAFRRFRLPGSAAAIKEPRRSALGVLYEIMGDDVLKREASPLSSSLLSFSDGELAVLARMLASGINSPWTTSAGRLFDAVSSVCGLRQRIRFEGQAAMELEFAAAAENTRDAYLFSLSGRREAGPEGPLTIIDWEPMIRAIMADVAEGLPPSKVSKKFHNTLVEIMVAVSRHVGEKQVVLTGGCFQNRILMESAVARLEEEGFRPYWHQRVPPNDGGIALGQIVAAARAAVNRGERGR